MPRPPHPLHFRLTLTGLNSMFYVLSFKGHEVPDQPYALDLVMLSEQADLDLTAQGFTAMCTILPKGQRPHIAPPIR